MKPNKAVVLFTNSYEDLKQKRTFISSKVSSSQILDLFLNQTINTLLRARKSIDFDIIISCNICSKEKISRKLQHSESISAQNHVKFLIQSGENFKERFIDSLKRVRDLGYGQIVSIGNDSPSLSSEIIIHSFKKLDSGNDVVLGPSFDGGFYLLGLTFISQSDQIWDEKIFDDIEWQTASVFNKLTRNLILLHYNYYLLPKLFDIDTGKDFVHWLKFRSQLSLLIKFLLQQQIYNHHNFYFPIINKQVTFAKEKSQKSPPF